MTDMASKRATSKCVATALVCQPCWVSCCWRSLSAHGYRTLRPQDTSASRQAGTLRHRYQDTLTAKTWYETLRHDTSAVIEEKPGHFDPGQFRWDTAPLVIRLKLRHQFCGADVSRCRSVLLPKCPSPAHTRQSDRQFYQSDGLLQIITDDTKC